MGGRAAVGVGPGAGGVGVAPGVAGAPPFLPVGARQAAEPLERASIVRAVVPRAALAGYGMPVESGSWTEPAQVALLWGEDRTVRAIRLAAPVQ